MEPGSPTLLTDIIHCFTLSVVMSPNLLIFFIVPAHGDFPPNSVDLRSGACNLLLSWAVVVRPPGFEPGIAGLEGLSPEPD